MSLPWTERFRPRTYDDLVVDGNRGALEELRAWMLDWRNGILRGQIPAARVAFLYGPPGIGKTASVEALARDLGFDLFELNASDKRTAENIRRYVGRGLASAWTPSGKMRMILIDEVDGIHSQNDRGGLGVLRDMILRSRVPVVLVANDAFQRRLRPLMAISKKVEYRRPSARAIARRLLEICDAVGVRAEPEALELIAERSEGDLRSAIADLQALAEGRDALTYEDALQLAGSRDRKGKIFDVLRRIFRGEAGSEAVRQVYVDAENLFEWIYENVPYQITDPHDLWVVMEHMSRADIYLKRSSPGRSPRADVRLMKYFHEFMTACFSLAKRGPTVWRRIRTPERRRLLSRMRGVRETERMLGRRIGGRCHASARKALREFVPFLRVIFREDERMARGLAGWLGLDERAVGYLRSKPPRTIS